MAPAAQASVEDEDEDEGDEGPLATQKIILIVVAGLLAISVILNIWLALR